MKKKWKEKAYIKISKKDREYIKNSPFYKFYIKKKGVTEYDTIKNLNREKFYDAMNIPKNIEILIKIARDKDYSYKFTSCAGECALKLLSLYPDSVTEDHCIKLCNLLSYEDEIVSSEFIFYESLIDYFCKFGTKMLRALADFILNKKPFNLNSRNAALILFDAVLFGGDGTNVKYYDENLSAYQLEKFEFAKVYIREIIKNYRVESDEFMSTLISIIFYFKYKHGFYTLKKYIIKNENNLFHSYDEIIYRLFGKEGIIKEGIKRLCGHCGIHTVICESDIRKKLNLRRKKYLKLYKKYYQDKEFEKAIESITIIISSNFKNADIFETLSKIYYEKQNYNNALVYIYLARFQTVKIVDREFCTKDSYTKNLENIVFKRLENFNIRKNRKYNFSSYKFILFDVKKSDPQIKPKQYFIKTKTPKKECFLSIKNSLFIYFSNFNFSDSSSNNDKNKNKKKKKKKKNFENENFDTTKNDMNVVIFNYKNGVKKIVKINKKDQKKNEDEKILVPTSKNENENENKNKKKHQIKYENPKIKEQNKFFYNLYLSKSGDLFLNNAETRKFTNFLKIKNENTLELSEPLKTERVEKSDFYELTKHVVVNSTLNLILLISNKEIKIYNLKTYKYIRSIYGFQMIGCYYMYESVDENFLIFSCGIINSRIHEFNLQTFQLTDSYFRSNYFERLKNNNNYNFEPIFITANKRYVCVNYDDGNHLNFNEIDGLKGGGKVCVYQRNSNSYFEFIFEDINNNNGMKGDVGNNNKGSKKNILYPQYLSIDDDSDLCVVSFLNGQFEIIDCNEKKKLNILKYTNFKPLINNKDDEKKKRRMRRRKRYYSDDDFSNFKEERKHLGIKIKFIKNENNENNHLDNNHIEIVTAGLELGIVKTYKFEIKKCCNFCRRIQKKNINSKEIIIKLSICSRCKQVFYCSVNCQKRDWKNHKLKCKKK